MTASSNEKIRAFVTATERDIVVTVDFLFTSVTTLPNQFEFYRVTPTEISVFNPAVGDFTVSDPTTPGLRNSFGLRLSETVAADSPGILVLRRQRAVDNTFRDGQPQGQEQVLDRLARAINELVERDKRSLKFFRSDNEDDANVDPDKLELNIAGQAHRVLTVNTDGTGFVLADASAFVSGGGTGGDSEVIRNVLSELDEITAGLERLRESVAAADRKAQTALDSFRDYDTSTEVDTKVSAGVTAANDYTDEQIADLPTGGDGGDGLSVGELETIFENDAGEISVDDAARVLFHLPHQQTTSHPHPERNINRLDATDQTNSGAVVNTPSSLTPQNRILQIPGGSITTHRATAVFFPTDGVRKFEYEGVVYDLTASRHALSAERFPISRQGLHLTDEFGNEHEGVLIISATRVTLVTNIQSTTQTYRRYVGGRRVESVEDQWDENRAKINDVVYGGFDWNTTYFGDGAGNLAYTGKRLYILSGQRRNPDPSVGGYLNTINIAFRDFRSVFDSATDVFRSLNLESLFQQFIERPDDKSHTTIAHALSAVGVNEAAIASISEELARISREGGALEANKFIDFINRQLPATAGFTLEGLIGVGRTETGSGELVFPSTGIAQIGGPAFSNDVGIDFRYIQHQSAGPIFFTTTATPSIRFALRDDHDVSVEIAVDNNIGDTVVQTDINNPPTSYGTPVVLLYVQNAFYLIWTSATSFPANAAPATLHVLTAEGRGSSTANYQEFTGDREPRLNSLQVFGYKFESDGSGTDAFARLDAWRNAYVAALDGSDSAPAPPAIRFVIPPVAATRDTPAQNTFSLRKAQLVEGTRVEHSLRRIAQESPNLQYLSPPITRRLLSTTSDLGASSSPAVSILAIKSTDAEPLNVARGRPPVALGAVEQGNFRVSINGIIVPAILIFSGNNAFFNIDLAFPTANHLGQSGSDSTGTLNDRIRAFWDANKDRLFATNATNNFVYALDADDLVINSGLITVGGSAPAISYRWSSPASDVASDIGALNTELNSGMGLRSDSFARLGLEIQFGPRGSYNLDNVPIRSFIFRDDGMTFFKNTAGEVSPFGGGGGGGQNIRRRLLTRAARPTEYRNNATGFAGWAWQVKLTELDITGLTVGKRYIGNVNVNMLVGSTVTDFATINCINVNTVTPRDVNTVLGAGGINVVSNGVTNAPARNNNTLFASFDFIAHATNFIVICGHFNSTDVFTVSKFVFKEFEETPTVTNLTSNDFSS